MSDVRLIPEVDGEYAGGLMDEREPGEELTVRISNPDAENGYGECRGGLSWLNSARITADPDKDEVSCCVSVGDPRGCFVFTMRRTPDGHLLLHMPHPSDGMAHMETAELHEGTLIVVKRRGETEPADFNEEPVEVECPVCKQDVDEDDTEECDICGLMVCHDCFDDEAGMCTDCATDDE
jgi:hypothetical protein